MSLRPRTLLLDGQVFQTEAWDRGMGKYMLQLMKSMSESKPDDMELKIIFNSRIETDEVRFETITYLCPNFEHLFAELPLATSRHTSARQYVRILDKFIADNVDSNRQLTYMITSLFMFDVFAEFPRAADIKTLIFYDLIPLLNWSDLGGYFPPHLYMSRFDRLYESDIVFCISETTRQDVIDTFGVDDVKAVNINGGFTEHHLLAAKPTTFVVPPHFILFPSGDLPHKNNDLIFRAFKKVVASNKDIHLLVTSRFSEVTKEKLQSIGARNVVFTGNVSDEELQYLYQHAAAVLFGSKYEGLGLPVLDAVFHEKPVVASDIDVFKEMSEDAFYLFKVSEVRAASEAIVSALKKKSFKQKRAHYPAILAKYDWKNVADTVLSHIKTATKKDLSATSQPISKIAIVALNPGIQGTAGRIAEPLYGKLKGKVQLDYFFDSCGFLPTELERPTFLDYVDGARSYDIKRLTITRYKKYDRVFYLFDTAATNYVIMQYIATLPGYVIYNDTMDTHSNMYQIASAMSLKKQAFNGKKPDNDAIAIGILRIVQANAPQNEAVAILKGYTPMFVKRIWLKKSKGLDL